MHVSSVFKCLFLCFVLACTAGSSGAAENIVTSLHHKLADKAQWVNTTRPITADDLSGRILLVDFWTSGCINCMHLVPKLKALETEFGDQLTVIGVHSAKFQAEGDTSNIRNAMAKYGIEHAVINDADFKIWDAFGIRAWPTVLLISPQGLIKQVYRGEGDINRMRQDIKTLADQSNVAIKTQPLPVAAANTTQTILSFPAKLALYLPVTGAPQLVISDSGHHRIILSDVKTGAIQSIIGSGEQGYADGSFAQARFDSPHGVLATANLIYVADTNNHRIRVIDLDSQTVRTLAGTGVRGSPITDNVLALKTALASPWDLAFYPNKQHIAIANAGTHQLLSYTVSEKTLTALAGSGAESIADGALPDNALSQPSGLAVNQDQLYFVDAESSMLRVLKPDQTIQTLIGKGLFDFGLKDGDRNTALMQHAQGVAAAPDGRIYIADTYNQRIRLYARGQLSTLPVTGLAQPDDVLVYNDRLYITDTNNNRIVHTALDGTNQTVLDVQ